MRSAALPDEIRHAEQDERDALVARGRRAAELAEAERRVAEITPVRDGRAPRRRARRNGPSGGRRSPRRTPQTPSRGCGERVEDARPRRGRAQGGGRRPRGRGAAGRRRGRRGAASFRVRPLGARHAPSPRSTSGGHAPMPRCSSSVAASRASGRGSCSRRMPWRQPRSASRRPVRASRSCGAGSRSRWRRDLGEADRPALGEARVVRPQVERAAVAAPSGRR